jgi:hypothetical protein
MATVFKPTEKVMIEEYNELKNIPQFAILTDEELRFVWYYANPTSPFADKETIKKFNLSFDSAFGKISNADMKVQYEFAKTRPEKITKAIERMANIDVSARIKAKMLLKTMLNNMYEMVLNDYEINDPSQGKNYVELCAKVSRELPHIIKLNEEGFGVVEEEVEEKPEEEVEVKETPNIGNILHGIKNDS